MKTALTTKAAHAVSRDVAICVGKTRLLGQLSIPSQTTGLVLFAHGSGSSRHSPRNQFVAQVIREAGIGTLLFDLLTASEEAEDQLNGSYRFDIRLLAHRLVVAAQWALRKEETRNLRLGFFGSSTGAAAALIAAAELRDNVGAVVSRGGRPDLAITSLAHVSAPTLLIVGEKDEIVLRLNEQAFAGLQCDKKLEIVPEAGHLFEEPGSLENVASLAANWFARYLRANPLKFEGA